MGMREVWRRWAARLWPEEDREQGKMFLPMTLVILPLLLLMLGVTHDLGNAAAAVAVAHNAGDLAAQEAGKVIDVGHFMEWQEVRLRPEAAAIAQQVADDLTQGAFRVDAVYVEGNVIAVEGRVSVRTPFMATFLGVPRLTRPVVATAEIVHGVEQAGE